MDIKYLAGFFDGEGYSGAVKWQNRWRPAISISNSNLEILKEIHNFIPLGILANHGKGSSGGKDVWAIHIFKFEDVVKFADLILNEIKVKKKQLKITRDFAEYLSQNRRKHKTWMHKKSTWTEEEIHFIWEKFVQPLKTLNRKGV